jgi:hypothetical protein
VAATRLRFGVTVFLCCIAIAPAASAEHLNILMIGNSYTQGNATARATSLDVQGLFDADPLFSATVTVRADSSASLEDHAANPLTTSLLTNSSNKWDVIVLQEQSERPGLAMKNGGGQLAGLNDGGPVLLNDYIEPFQPQARVVLFDTWARTLGNQDLIDDFDNKPSEMQSYTNQGYDRIRKNGSTWDFSGFTSIARVGDAWGNWYGTYGYGNSNGLHDSDGSHQNAMRSYLAAAVIFETITGKSTVGNSYTGAVSGTIGGVSRVQLLQQLATTTTAAVPGLPGDYNSDGIVDGADYTLWRTRLGSQVSLPNDNTPGVGLDDYDRWKSHFGIASDSLVGFENSVPEPGCAGVLVLGAVLFGCHQFCRKVVGQRTRTDVA